MMEPEIGLKKVRRGELTTFSTLDFPNRFESALWATPLKSMANC